MHYAQRKGVLIMALRWQWNECIGELEIENQSKARIRVYQGNALLIFLNEWENKDGQNVWSMYNFFTDKGHFDNCRKNNTWDYSEGWKKLTLWKVPSDVWHVLKDLHKRGVKIKIRSKENENRKAD